MLLLSGYPSIITFVPAEGADFGENFYRMLFTLDGEQIRLETVLSEPSFGGISRGSEIIVAAERSGQNYLDCYLIYLVKEGRFVFVKDTSLSPLLMGCVLLGTVFHFMGPELWGWALGLLPLVKVPEIIDDKFMIDRARKDILGKLEESP